MADVRINMMLVDMNNTIGRRTQAVQGLNRQLQRTQQLSQAAGGGGASGQTVAYNRARATGAGSTGSEARDFAAQSQGLGGVVRLYATFAANIYAVSAAFTALREAANFERMIQGSKLMSIQTGTNILALGKSLQEATGYAVSFEQAMQFANLGTSAGIAAKQMTSLVKIAKGAAVGLGRDVEDSVRRIVQGTAKQEQEILDELGIFIKAQKAYDDYAKKFDIKGGADALSAQQRVAAYADAVEAAGEKWKEFAQIDDPFSRFVASGQEALRGILDFINKGLTPFLKYLADSKDAIQGLIVLLGGTLAIKALPQIKSVLQDVFSFNKQRMAAQAEAQRQAIRQELNQTNQLIQTLQSRVQAVPQFGQAELLAKYAGSGMLVPSGSAGLSAQRLTSTILGTAANPANLANYRTVQDIESKILSTVKAQVGAKQQVLDTMIRLGVVERTSTLQNIQLSNQQRLIAQEIFNSINQRNQALTAQTTIQNNLNNAVATQAGLQGRLSNLTGNTGVLVPRAFGSGTGAQLTQQAQAAGAAGALGAAQGVQQAGGALGNLANAYAAAGRAAGSFSSAMQLVALSSSRMQDAVGGTMLQKLTAFKNIMLDNVAIITNASTWMGKLGATIGALGTIISGALRGLMALAGPLLIIYSLWEIFKDKLLPETYKKTREVEEAYKDLIEAFNNSNSALTKANQAYINSNKSAGEYVQYLNITNNAIQTQIDSIDQLILKKQQLADAESKKQTSKTGETPQSELTVGARRSIGDLFASGGLDSATFKQYTDTLNEIDRIQNVIRSGNVKDLAIQSQRVQAFDREAELKRQAIRDELDGTQDAQQIQSVRARLSDLIRDQQTERNSLINQETAQLQQNKGLLDGQLLTIRQMLIESQRLAQQRMAEAGSLEAIYKAGDRAVDSYNKKFKKQPVGNMFGIGLTEEAQAVSKVFETAFNPPKFESSYDVILREVIDSLGTLKTTIPEAGTLLDTIFSSMAGRGATAKAVIESMRTELAKFGIVVQKVNNVTDKYSLEAKKGFKEVESAINALVLAQKNLDLEVAKTNPYIERTQSMLGYYTKEHSNQLYTQELNKAQLKYQEEARKAELDRNKITEDNTRSKEEKRAAEVAYNFKMAQLGVDLKIGQQNAENNRTNREIGRTVFDINELYKEQVYNIERAAGLEQGRLTLQREYLNIAKSGSMMSNTEVARSEKALDLLEAENSARDKIAKNQAEYAKRVKEIIASETSPSDQITAIAAAGVQLLRNNDLARDELDTKKSVIEITKTQALLEAEVADKMALITREQNLQEIKMNTAQALRSEELRLLEQSYNQGKLTTDQYNLQKRVLEDIAAEEDYRRNRQEILNKYVKEELKLKAQIAAIERAGEGEAPQYLLDQLRSSEAAKQAELSGLDRIKGAQDQYRDSMEMLTERQKGYEDIFKASFDRMADAWVNFANTGKFTIKSMVNSMLEDILRWEVKQAQLQAWSSVRKPVLDWIGQLFGGSPWTGPGFGDSVVGVSAGAPGVFVSAKGSYFSGSSSDFASGAMQKFAKGGMFTNSIVDNPTIFKFAKGVGMMGEAGPEAIMPLKRDNSGNLGVRAQGSKTEVVVNNYGDQKATAEETVDSRGNRRIEVTIGDMTAGEIARPGGAPNRAIKSTFGVKPQLIRR